MAFLGFLVAILFKIIDGLIYVYIWVVIIRVFMSWIQPNPYNPIVVAIEKVTDPPLDFISRYIRTRFLGFDFAPVILIVALGVLESLLHFTYITYIIPLFK